jgi:WD40 repeat protein
VAFSPDGKLLISGSSDPYARLWEVGTGKLLARSPESTEGGHTNSVSALIFNSDDVITTASWDNTVRVWKLDRASNHFTLTDVLYGHSNSIWTVAFNPGQKILASGSSDESVIIWKMDQLNQVGHQVAQMGNNVWALAVSPDRKLVSAGDEAGHIQLWNFDGKELKELKPIQHPGSVLTLAFSPREPILVSAGSGMDIAAWDIETGGKHWIIPAAHQSDIWSLAFSPDGRFLASASLDQTVKIWDVDTQKQIGDPVTFETGVYALAFNKSGDHLLVAGYDRSIAILNISPAGVASQAQPLQGHDAAVNSISFNPDAPSILASTSDDKTLLIWNVEKLQHTAPVMGLGESMEAVTFNPNGDELASATNNRTVLLWKWDANCKDITKWDPAQCQPARLGSPLVGHDTQVQNVLFLSPTKLLSSSEDGQLILWDLDTSHWYEQACAIVSDTWDRNEQIRYTDERLNMRLLGARAWWLKLTGQSLPASPSCLVDD